MSFQELSISIIAENLATAEFNKVASDASRMATEVSGSHITLQTENLASPEINRVAEDAARVKAQVEASPITISFAPVELPAIPVIEAAPIQTSFAPIELPSIPPIHVPAEITFAPVEVPAIPPLDVSSIHESKVAFADAGLAATQMGENIKAVGPSLVELKGHAEATSVSLRTVGMAFTSIAAMGSAVISLAGDFGIVDRESAKWARTMMAVFTLVSAYIRLKHYMTVVTTGHSAAIAVNTTAQSANASASIASAVAYKVKAAATWIAVHAQNALNISHATFLALTGVGIGVIIAAAAAMAYFASQMNAATSSVKEYNAAVAETPARTRGITRAGEEEMYRRGVE